MFLFPFSFHLGGGHPLPTPARYVRYRSISTYFSHNFVVTNKCCQYLYTIHQILDPPLTRSSLTLFSSYCFAEKYCLLHSWKKKSLPLSGEQKNSLPLPGEKKNLSPCLVGKKNSLPSGKNHSPPPIDINWYVP